MILYTYQRSESENSHYPRCAEETHSRVPVLPHDDSLRKQEKEERSKNKGAKRSRPVVLVTEAAMSKGLKELIKEKNQSGQQFKQDSNEGGILLFERNEKKIARYAHEQ